MAQHGNEYHNPDMAPATHDHDVDYASLADGVTGGDAHDHAGGDGGQIDHAGLANKGANTHGQIDTHLGATAPHTGHETPGGAQAKVDVHGALPAPHSGHETPAGAQGKVDTHAAVAAPHSGHVQIGGQLGGVTASPDVRGIRETSGPTLLTIGAVADGQYLLRSGGTLIGGSPGGGSPPAWKGAIAAAWGDGDPAPALRHMQAVGVISPTPTNIGIAVARCAFFKLDTQLIVNKIRWYEVGATTGIYRVAVYRISDNVRMAILNDFNTGAAAWGNGAFSCTLAANILYLVAVAVDAVGTTAGILALGPTVAATTGMMVLPTGWPGNLDFDVASPKVAPFGFCQFAVTTGALPTTLPSLVNQAAWTGGMPAFFMDNNNA